jgi:Tol biopolymer transport system component
MNYFRRADPAVCGVAGMVEVLTFDRPSALVSRWLCCVVCGLLVTVSAFAAEPVQLTQDGSLKRDARFVDGGRSVVYCYDETPALVRMMKMSLDDRVAKPVFEDAADKHHYEPAFSPNGKWISFTACTGNLSGKLVIRNLESGAQADITHKGRGGTRSPTFSPNNERVIYAFAEKGPQQLWSVKTDGTDKQQLTTCSGVSNWPSFTPDGRTIVFSNSREKNYEIYSVGADGSGERRLTNNTLMDIRPAVSPDGRRIAFVSTRTGNYDVFVMNIDGSNVRQITTSEERDDYPNWHPDGEQLVIVSERDGAFDLYLVDAPPGRTVAGR